MSAPNVVEGYRRPPLEQLYHEDDAGRAFGWELLLLWALTAAVTVAGVGVVLGLGWLLWKLGAVRAFALVLLVAGSLLIAWALAKAEGGES